MLKFIAAFLKARGQDTQYTVRAWVSIRRCFIVPLCAQWIASGRYGLQVDHAPLAYPNNLPCKKQMNVAVLNANQGRAGWTAWLA